MTKKKLSFSQDIDISIHCKFRSCVAYGFKIIQPKNAKLTDIK